MKTETIPERDNVTEKAHKATDKARVKEKRFARRDSRSTLVDVIVSMCLDITSRWDRVEG